MRKIKLFKKTQMLNSHTYCLGDLVFDAFAQNPLEYKWISKFLRLKHVDKNIMKKEDAN